MTTTAKSVWRVLGQVASVLLSIVLVILLLIAPLYSAAASLLQPSTVTGILQECVSALMQEADATLEEQTPALSNQKSGVKGAVITPSSDTPIDADAIADTAQNYLTTLLGTPLAEDFIALYMNDVYAALNGEIIEPSLNYNSLKQLADTHMDDIVVIIKDNVPETASMSDEELRHHINKAIDENSEDIIAILPNMESISSAADEIRQIPVVALAFNRMLPYYLYGVVLLLGVMIFFCLYGGARGLRCLGIDALVACIPLYGIAWLIGDGSTLASFIGMPAEESTVLVPIMSTFSGRILTGAIILTVLGILFIGGFIAFCTYKKKKAQTAVPAIEANTAIPDITIEE